MLNNNLQVADCPKLPMTDTQFTANDLIGPILMQAHLQIGALFSAQFEGVLTLPARSQSAQATLLIPLRPYANAASHAAHQRFNALPAHPTSIQSHCLQPFQFINIPRFLLCLAERCDLYFTQAELSFCHALSLHEERSFGFVHQYIHQVQCMVIRCKKLNRRERVPEYLEQFLIELPLEECIHRLRGLSHQYFSVKLKVSPRRIDPNHYQFHVSAKGVSRNSMDLTLVGGMDLETSSSTLVTIQSVVPNKGSYLPQYFWVVSP